MHTRLWLLNLLVFISYCQNIYAQSSTTSTRSVQPVVYTAETARQLQTPYPSTSKSPIPSSTKEYNPNSRSTTVEAPEAENVGFVDPASIDFNKFFANVAYDTGSKKSSTFNPFTSESKSKDSFPDFFNSNSEKSRDDPYFEPFGSLSSSASNQNSRKPQRNEDGFVDPNVQFRSLFDSTETADGFQPEEFLNYNGESVGSDPSKGSQTRAYPSFTYTGRRDGEDDVNDSPESSNPRYRSSYRQVNGREQRDPYDDRNYYGGEYDSSPRAPAPPPRRYQVNNGNSRETSHAPSSQETSHSPQATGEKHKGEAAQASKNKCKKVEKEVDDEEDYESYTNPEEGGYDPSTYNSRYKRQAGRKNQKKKGRPMTCYVCEDEEGRYAERCSYDSNSDPKNGGYFHSSSTSYNDNGRRPSRDRHRRNPKSSKTLATSASALFITSTKSDPNVADDSVPRRLEKRQSQGNRYASGYRDPNAEIHKAPEHNYDDYEGPDNYYGRTSSSNSRDDEEDGPDYGFAPSGPAERNPHRNSNNRNNNHRDFDFGPPEDFGKDAGQDSPGFTYDYDPREFERPGASGQRASNSHNRPVFSSDDFTKGFDVEYDDYIKKYFPDAFGDSGGSSGGGGRPSSPPRPSRPTYHHHHHEPEHSPPSGPSHRGPDKEPTHPAHHYSPPPYYRQGPEESPEYLQKALTSFSQKDRRNCQKVQKGDMTCYVCRDQRGMNKEECMYASNDPRNNAMAYHEVTEYSSLQPSKVLPGTQPKQLEKAASTTKEVKDYDFDY